MEFLRQSSQDNAQRILADDIFLHETNLWNMLAGPTFRCELLVTTQCSDEADDACFSSRVVSWTDSVAHDTPLFVQPSDSDDSFAAKLHRYSGVVQKAKGVQGKCCIPYCSRLCPEERPYGLQCSYLKEHPKREKDIVKVGPFCHVHWKDITRVDKRNRNRKTLDSKMRARTCWMNPLEIAIRDENKTDAIDLVSQDIENICIRYHDSRIATQTDVTYTRC